MSSNRFFSVDSAKAIKAQSYGYLNAINYMAPASTAGVGNLCPHASPGCLALCLGWYSGQAAMLSNAELETGSNATRESRVRKAQLFMHDRAAFMHDMIKGLNSAKRKARKLKLKLCVRLNGATDIAWEGIRIAELGGLNIFDAWPDTQFVDYTKSVKRALAHAAGKMPPNYHLTFSRSETNEADCKLVLAAGGNVAVVFATGSKRDRMGNLGGNGVPDRPTLFWGYPVIDGDLSDLRHLDEKGGVIIGLKPKGRKTKNDTSGFVVRSI